MDVPIGVVTRPDARICPGGPELLPGLPGLYPIFLPGLYPDFE